MEFDLSPSQRELFDEIVRLARGMQLPDREGTLPRARWDAIRAAGLAGLAAPRHAGGLGAGTATHLMLAMQAFGYARDDAPTLSAMACHLFGGVLPLSRYGTPEQQAGWLPRLVSGECYAARALPGAMEAAPAADGFRLTGVVGIASAAVRPDVALVFARLPQSSESVSHAFLVPLPESGMWDSANDSRHARADRLRLDGVAVPQSLILGRDGHAAALLAELLSHEQLALHAVRLGMLQRLLETALESARKYTRGLKLQGIPPHRYQILGHRLADFRVRFDAAELLLRRAAWQLEQRAAETEVALAGLAIENSLLPIAFEIVKLQHDYVLDENQAWTGLLTDAVEYGRYLCSPTQMRIIVNRDLQAGRA